MKHRKRILQILICIVLLGLAGHFVTRFGPRTMKVELSGTPGMEVAGRYTADGSAFNFSGVVPTNFVVEAKHLAYTITNLGPDGELEGRLFVGDKLVGMSKTPRPFGGVAGDYAFDGSLFYRKADSRFTTVSQEE
jgi:hypothetical protein